MILFFALAGVLLALLAFFAGYSVGRDEEEDIYGAGYTDGYTDGFGAAWKTWEKTR